MISSLSSISSDVLAHILSYLPPKHTVFCAVSWQWFHANHLCHLHASSLPPQNVLEELISHPVKSIALSLRDCAELDLGLHNAGQTQHLHSTLESLGKLNQLERLRMDFSNSTLRLETVELLASCISRYTRLTELALDFSGLLSLSTSEVTSLLSSLTEAFNPMGLPSLTRLELNIGKNKLQDSALRALNPIWRNVNSGLLVLKLNLGQNQLTAAAIKTLDSWATAFPKLRELSVDLNHNTIGNQGMEQLSNIVRGVVGSSHRLEKIWLNLEDGGFYQNGLNLLCQALKVPVLVSETSTAALKSLTLKLYSNNLGFRGAHMISDLLETYPFAVVEFEDYS